MAGHCHAPCLGPQHHPTIRHQIWGTLVVPGGHFGRDPLPRSVPSALCCMGTGISCLSGATCETRARAGKQPPTCRYTTGEGTGHPRFLNPHFLTHCRCPKGTPGSAKQGRGSPASTGQSLGSTARVGTRCACPLPPAPSPQGSPQATMFGHGSHYASLPSRLPLSAAHTGHPLQALTFVTANI